MRLEKADNSTRSRLHLRKLPLLAAFLGVALTAGSGLSQEEGEGNSAGQGANQASSSTSTTTSTTYSQPWVPRPGTNIDGHLPSSSRSKANINSPDQFDLGTSREPAATMHGDKNSLGILEGDRVAAEGIQPRNPMHVVSKGDTLWGICQRQFDDPRMWPRVWSFNPQVQNPHWIYPGDQLRLAPSFESGTSGLSDSAILPRLQSGILGSGRFVARQQLVPPETVFLRELGYIDEPGDEDWGQVVGARVERQLLAEGNEIYMILRPGVSVKIGQKMTVFRDVRKPQPIPGARVPPGRIVAFKGTVEINGWDAKTRIARGRLTESLDIIERGAKVGPIGRRFYVVPPKPSEIDLRARVLTSLYPHLLMGQNQVFFIDRGTNDGLKPGNRLFVVRRGDAWRRTLVTTTVMARTRIRMDVPESVDTEETPLFGDEQDFPEESIAEVRVIRTHRFASMVLVTSSQEEIEPGDTLVARKGY